MPPHVCHITTAHPSFDSRIFRRACVSLAKHGFRVTLICRHEREELVQGVRLVPLPPCKGKLMRRLWLTTVAARMARDLRADLYHFHDPELIPAMQWLARRTTSPIVWDAHEDFVGSIEHHNQFHVSAVSRIASALFDRLELRACARRFAAVVTVNDAMAERYRRRGLPATVVGNYVDLAELAGNRSARRAEIPRIVNIASHNRDRLVHEIADAFALARQRDCCQLAFFGQFSPGSLGDEVQRRACALGAPPSDVICGGPYPWRQLVGELAPTGWCGCVLMNPANPNNRRGLPNRLFEFWANGVPVVATEGTYVANVVQAEGGGIVVPAGKVDALADAFQQLCSNADLVDTLGRAGRNAVAQKYNWSNAFASLVEMYARLGIRPSTTALRNCA